jgi:DNA polymerase-3 subunit beta
LERSLNSADKVTIYYEGLPEQPSNFVAFEWNNWRLTTKLLEGQYPICDQLIAPYRPEFSHQVVVERLSFLKALERLASHSDKCDIRYLIDTAKAISSSDLRVLMATPTTPLLIAPFGTPASGTEALDCEYIVAPQE